MKKINFFLILLSWLSILSCGKDGFQEDKIKSSLSQTFWKGELIINKNGVSSTCSINITFESDGSGNYQTENFESNETSSSYGGFIYKVDGKVLQISGRFDNILNGDWWKTEEQKNILTLKRTLIDPRYTSTLVIKK